MSAALGRRQLTLLDAARVARGSRPVVWYRVALVWFGIFGVADWVSGPQLSMVAAYAIAVAGLAWTTGRTPALIAVGGVTAFGVALAVAHPEVTWTFATALSTVLRGAVLVGLAMLADSLRATLVQLDDLASVDPLTGQCSRRRIFELVDVERARSLRSGDPLAVAYIDLDGLKRINDTEGHAAGDAHIVRYTGMVVRSLRPTDWFGRLGGDEFVVLLPQTDLAGARQLFDRILDQPDLPRSTVGVVVWAAPTDDAERLVTTADQTMYRARQAGVRLLIEPGVAEEADTTGDSAV